MTENRWTPSDRNREPASLGEHVVDPAGWYPEDVRGKEDWIYRLSDSEISEIETAVAAAEKQGLPLIEIDKDAFPLPRFAETLRDIQEEVMLGRGFAFLRGLPIAGRSRSWVATAFWGLGRHMGAPVSQNAKGHLLGHVVDLGGDYAKVRGYMTRAHMDFHTDRADILSLCCMHPAKSGGEHRICSSVTVYNEMVKQRPDLAAELAFRFYKSRNGEIPPGETEPWTRLAIAHIHEGYLAVRGGNAGVRKAQEIPGVPKLTEAQLEALALFRKLALDLSVDIAFEIGDISYVQNYVTMHSRTAFEDWPEPERKRHLLRLWLNNGLRPLDDEILEEIAGVKVDNMEYRTPLEFA